MSKGIRMEITLDILKNNEMDENAIFIRRDDDKDGVLVDPGVGKKEILDFLSKNNYIVSHILITHAHFDHIASVPDVVDKYKCDIYVHENDLEMMEDPIKNESNLFGGDLSIKGSKIFKNGDILDLCGIKFKVLHTPGHTKGSSSFYIEDKKLLISGDTLFELSFGRTDFYGGSMDEIANSLKNILFKLPDDVKVIPGHGNMTTIGKEKKYNMILEF